MKNDVSFTIEELLFIEKIMDINASILDKNIHQLCDDFVFSMTTDNPELKRLMAKSIEENGSSQLITESIRKKIEDLRK